MTAPTHQYQAVVLEVHDGDTVKLAFDLGRLRRADHDYGFHVHGEHGRLTVHDQVRLAGINAPELATPDGIVAHVFLVALLTAPDGTFLPLTVRTSVVAGHDAQEKYGRWLAELWLPGEDPDTFPSVNARMVTAGHATPYDGHGPKTLDVSPAGGALVAAPPQRRSVMTLTRQPVAAGAAVLAWAQATPALLVGLGVVRWTPGQIGLVQGYVALLTALVATVVHGLVTPVAAPNLPQAAGVGAVPPNTP